MDRNVVRGATAIVLALMTLAPAAAVAQEIKVTPLGTGTPVPAMNRFGPSILVEAAMMIGRRPTAPFSSPRTLMREWFSTEAD